MRIGSLLALMAACLLAARGPAAALASCGVSAASHACCSGMESGSDAGEAGSCPTGGAMPCCRLTKPAPASPSVLTASGVAPALLASAELLAAPVALADAASPAPPLPALRSSPPVSVLRI
jgi:hypothetical protein